MTINLIKLLLITNFNATELFDFCACQQAWSQSVQSKSLSITLCQQHISPTVSSHHSGYMLVHYFTCLCQLHTCTCLLCNGQSQQFMLNVLMQIGSWGSLT